MKIEKKQEILEIIEDYEDLIDLRKSKEESKSDQAIDLKDVISDLGLD